MTDHVAEWTLKAGQVSASRKAHADPRITARPGAEDAARAGAELAGRPAHAEVGGGRERHAADHRERVHRPEAGRARRWRSWPSRSTRCPTSGVRAVAGRRRRRSRDRVPVPRARAPAVRRLPRLSAARGPLASFTNARLGRARPRGSGSPTTRGCSTTRAFTRASGTPRSTRSRARCRSSRCRSCWRCAAQPRRAADRCCAALLLPVHALGGHGRADLALAARPGGRPVQLLPAARSGVPARSWLADPATAMWAIIAHHRLVGDRLLPGDLPGRAAGHPARPLRGGRARRRRRLAQLLGDHAAAAAPGVAVRRASRTSSARSRSSARSSC